MATKLNIENLPLTIDGKIEMVRRAQYENHRAQSLTVKYKTDIKKSDVKGLLDLIEAGKELPAENEEVFHKVFADLKEDVELAQDKVQEEIEKQQAKEKEEKEKEEAELKLATGLVTTATATKEITGVFGSLSEKFDIGNLDRCVPKKGTTTQDALTALAASFKMGEFNNWMKGDLVAWLESQGQEKAMTILSQQTGVPYKSISRMAITARHVPPEKRNPAVSFTTYAEIATAKFTEGKTEEEKKKNEAKREELLEKIGPAPEPTKDKAKDEVEKAKVITTAQQARAAVAAAQGKTPPEKADPMAVDLEKHTFIVSQITDGELRVSACVGYPKSLEEADTDTVIVHAKTARKAFGTGKKMKWVALDEHKEPEPAPEPAPEPDKAPKKAGKKK